jgi:hypothetical protein
MRSKLYAGISRSIFILTLAAIFPIFVSTADAAPPIPDTPALYAAIDAANASGHPTNITLAEGGTYELSDGPLDITGKITLQGNNATINGTGDQVFHVTGDLKLIDLTVTGGSADSGGAIYNNYGTVTLSGNSSIAENMARYGGGIYNDHGTVTLNGNSTISGNTAKYFGSGGGAGGGIYNNFGTVTLNGDSSVTENISNYGGGIYNDHGTVILNGDSSISGNTAIYSGGGAGGGIFNDFGTVTLNGDSSITENMSEYAGGIFNYGTVTLNGNSSISENTPYSVLNVIGTVTLNGNSSIT